MAYSAETHTILSAVTAASELLDQLKDEHLIEEVYGGEITEVRSKLDDAESEAQYIEDQHDSDDVDIYEIYEASKEIDNLVDDVKDKVNEIEDLAETIRSNTRDYA